MRFFLGPGSLKDKEPQITVDDYETALGMACKLVLEKKTRYHVGVIRENPLRVEVVVIVYCGWMDAKKTKPAGWDIVYTYCKHCNQRWDDHANGKCLFHSTEFTVPEIKRKEDW
jgi:hypothetical protein